MSRESELLAPPQSEEGDLRAGAVSGLGVFAQGLAAAAPSVAIAGVPGSLFLVSGKGSLWAAVIGGALSCRRDIAERNVWGMSS